MNDMSQVIVPKSDQINADDLISGPMTIAIREVKITGGQEQPVSIMFDGSDKAFRPCKSMSRVLVAAWGPDAKAYVGRTLTLYRDPTVKWGGLEVGGIRISHMSHIDRDMVMALTATRGSRKPFKVKPMEVGATTPPADPAAKWTATFIGKIQGAPATAPALLEQQAKRLEELRAQRPELAAQIDVAAAEAAGGGKPDDMFGETPTLDEAKASVDRAETADQVLTKIDAYRGQLSDEDQQALSAYGAEVVELRGWE